MSIVIKGGSRCNRRYFTRHLLNRKDNDKVRVVACRGFARQDVAQAFEDMEVMARGTRTKNYFYPFSINPEPGEQLTDEQFDRAEDITLKHLGLEGQPRIVVEHTKKGRTHRHVAVFRIDEDGKAISDSLTYRKHEAAAREIEQELGLKPMQSVLRKGRDTERPLRRGPDWEGYRGSITGLDPLKVRDEVTKLRQEADGPQSFNAAMRQHGYILCQGDKRDYCFVDPAGKVHSLGRRVADLKAAELRKFMAGLDRQTLPTIEEAKKRAEPWGKSQAARTIQEAEAQKRVRKSMYAAARLREKMPEDAGGSDAARLRALEYERALHEHGHKPAGEPGSKHRRRPAKTGRSAPPGKKTGSRSGEAQNIEGRAVTELSLDFRAWQRYGASVFMMDGGFMSVPVLWPNEKDANNLDEIKDAVAAKAKDSDVQAAAVFAALMDAETRRAELIAREKTLQPKAPEAGSAQAPWTEKVNTPAIPFNAESAQERLV